MERLIITVFTLAVIVAAIIAEEEIMENLTGKSLLNAVYELIVEIIEQIKGD